MSKNGSKSDKSAEVDEKQSASFPNVSAFNGSLISSLTSPTLAAPLDTFKELHSHSDNIDILTYSGTSVEDYMRTTSNRYLRMLQELSKARGQDNVHNLRAAIEPFLNNPNKVFFSDMSFFVLQIQPPSGVGIGCYSYCNLDIA